MVVVVGGGFKVSQIALAGLHYGKCRRFKAEQRLLLFIR